MADNTTGDVISSILNVNEISIAKGTDIVTTTIKLWTGNPFYMAIYSFLVIWLLGYVAFPRAFGGFVNACLPRTFKDNIKSGKYDSKFRVTG